MWKEHKNPVLIYVQVMGVWTYIVVEQIKYCQAYGDYTHFYMNDDRKLLITGNLTESECLIDNDGFDRIHQSFLLNHQYFVSVCRKGNAKEAILTQGDPLPFSREGFKDWKKKYGRQAYGKNPEKHKMK